MLMGMKRTIRAPLARLRAVAIAGIVACLCSADALGQPRPPERPGTPRPTVAEAVIRAHREIGSAVIDVRFTPYFTYPDETEFITSAYRVVLDRQAKRLRVDRPGYTLICDGTDVLLVADELPGRHLRIPLNGPLTYKRLVEVFPDLHDPMPPALILLLADEPMAWLSDEVSDDATPFVPKHQGDRRTRGMRFNVGFGEAELLHNAKTKHLADLRVEVDRQQLVGSGLDAVQFHYSVKWSKVDEPIDAKVFELDLKGSAEMTTLAQFLTPSGPGNGPGGGPGNAGGGGGSLVGQPLPTSNSACLEARKRTTRSSCRIWTKAWWSLSFSRAGPGRACWTCRAGRLFKAWAEEQEHAVSVYAVAVGETPESIGRWLEALEKTAGREVDVPILLDSATDAAMALKLPTVPRTLIAVDGNIVEVFGGMKPEFLDDLKKGLPGWLEKVEAEEE